ncbi:MAG: sigma-54-dependent Fis family transcriptional regulator [Rhodospirillales bacterium]|nr:sigma-54-dependent Fis family transcriptional regulator [Rhodospirillales bacterium]
MNNPLRVILIEDDPAVRFGVVQALELADLTVEQFESADAAFPHIHPHLPGVIVSDVRMRGMSGLELLDRAIAIDADLPVILVTGHGDIAMAVQAMRRGAYDFLEKPFASERLVSTVQRALEKRSLTFEVQDLRRKLDDREGIGSVLVGASPEMERIRRTILGLAEAVPDVLICGETGSGKELVAQCLHRFSRRRDANFVALNCGGLPETTIDSELFGHEVGAFTGAVKRRVGKMEHAAGGTVFLDEIESMPLVIQVKMLRAIQERSVERLGSNVVIDVDVRFIAATKVDLEELSDDGRFRRDLYYRVNVVRIDLPPLRERRDDIPLLFEHFVLQAATRYCRQAPVVSSEMTRKLIAHPWPGNIRELRNVADRYVLGVLGRPFAGDDEIEPPRSLADQVDAFERMLLVEQLRRDQGNVTAASEALALPKKTLYDKIKKHGIPLDGFR